MILALMADINPGGKPNARARPKRVGRPVSHIGAVSARSMHLMPLIRGTKKRNSQSSHHKNPPPWPDEGCAPREREKFRHTQTQGNGRPCPKAEGDRVAGAPLGSGRKAR